MTIAPRCIATSWLRRPERFPLAESCSREIACDTPLTQPWVHRVPVPIACGEKLSWPPPLLFEIRLEAIANSWYEFRDSSYKVRLYNRFGFFVCVLLTMMLSHWVCFFVFFPLVHRAACGEQTLGGDRCYQQAADNRELCEPLVAEGACRFQDGVWERGGPRCVVADLDCDNISGMRLGFLAATAFSSAEIAFVLYVKYALLPWLHSEIRDRLALPLAATLADAGWHVRARQRVRERRAKAPDGLPLGCCDPGWLWLEFDQLPRLDRLEGSSQLIVDGAGARDVQVLELDPEDSCSHSQRSPRRSARMRRCGGWGRVMRSFDYELYVPIPTAHISDEEVAVDEKEIVTSDEEEFEFSDVPLAPVQSASSGPRADMAVSLLE